MHTARDEIVARAFGRRLRQNRGLDLEESVLAEISARRLHQPVTQYNVVLKLRAAEIEEAMTQPQLFCGEIFVARARDRNCRRRGWPDHLQRHASHFDVARRE